MHEFSDLIYRCSLFSLHALNKASEEMFEKLESSGGATHWVKGLQMINLNKVVQAVGMFSIFEAHLQSSLDCKNGFTAAKKLLLQGSEEDLHDQFSDLILAVNVLKHGKGRSYDELVQKASNLSFKIQLPDEPSTEEVDVSETEEVDVSEVFTLINVDDAFVKRCVGVIEDVTTVLRRVNPNFY